MLPGPPYMTPARAAAGICVALGIVTASAELADASGTDASGGLEAAAGEVAAASQDPAAPEAPPAGDQPAVEVTPTPTPTPEPSPEPPEAAPEPAPAAEEPVPPVAVVTPAPVALPDPGATGAGESAAAPQGGSADAASPDDAAPGRPRRAKDPARARPNTEARANGVLRPAPTARKRPRRERRGRRRADAPPRNGPVVKIPAQWLSGSVAADPIAIPDSLIDDFGIPPYLLPIYQAAGMRYGVPWEILAAINEIETAYGHNLDVSSAGALGWMQFMPSTWKAYAVDANDDGRRDPYNPVDAIFAAARYLDAAGAGTDMRKAIYAYNHADWYVDAVLARARAIAGLPSDLVDSLAGLARARFPVAAEATYARPGGDGARTAAGDRRTIAILSRPGARVIAVNDGRVVRVGYSARLGRFLKLRDIYGNTYTYGRMPRSRKPLRKGARLDAGATLGRLASRSAAARPRLLFQIRPAGPAAPRIDPQPILDGWRALEATAMQDAAGEPGIGRIGLMRSGTLARRVLADPRIEIYACGRDDIRAGRIDRRVLATLEFLAASGLAPTVSSLRCGHGVFTASGNVSEHTTGGAVDISAINGTPIVGHQGPGSVTEVTIQSLLTLQGAMKPHQIISLMTFAGADNTFAMGDHADHIHVGFRPAAGTAPASSAALLEPQQWTRLMERIAGL